jgi:hypothetical protein
MAKEQIGKLHYNTDIESFMKEIPEEMYKDIVKEFLEMRKAHLERQYKSWIKQYEAHKDDPEYRKRRNGYVKKSLARANVKENKISDSAASRAYASDEIINIK